MARDTARTGVEREVTLEPTHLSGARERVAPSESSPGFRAIYDEHHPFVWRALRWMGVREADVQDVCQEVFVVVHRRLPEFDGRSAVRTWIYAICLRAAAQYRRRAHVRREAVVDAVPEEAVPAPQPDDVARSEARAALAAILDELDDDKRAVFVLYEIEELPMLEVVAVVGCPLQTGYTRLHAARRHVEAAARRLQLRTRTP